MKENGSAPGVYFPSTRLRPLANWNQRSELRAGNEAARKPTTATRTTSTKSTAPNHSGQVAGLGGSFGVGCGAGDSMAGAAASGGAAVASLGMGSGGGLAFTGFPRPGMEVLSG